MSAPIEKLNDKFAETEIDDEIVVMHLDSGDFFSLTGTATDIWRLIDGTRTREAIVAELSAIYDSGAVAIASDVDGLLLQLSDAGIVARA